MFTFLDSDFHDIAKLPLPTKMSTAEKRNTQPIHSCFHKYI